LVLIVQFGAGVDHIDIDACTRASVAVVKHRRRRAPAGGGCDPDPYSCARRSFPGQGSSGAFRTRRRVQAAAMTGVGLRGKTLGSVRLGGIASELFRLVRRWIWS
jgi:phosphoglycerate dehydrogenase-like enzyme